MTHDIQLDLLDDLRIASPCPMRWDDLEGDGARRFCGKCQLHVHDFSAMARSEIEDVLRSEDGRVCATFYRRADGTIMTRDCPVGLRAARQKAARAMGRIAAALGLMLSGGVVLARSHDGTEAPRLRARQPFPQICAWLAPTRTGLAAPPVQPLIGEVVLGRIACPPPATTPPSTLADE